MIKQICYCALILVVLSCSKDGFRRDVYHSDAQILFLNTKAQIKTDSPATIDSSLFVSTEDIYQYSQIQLKADKEKGSAQITLKDYNGYPTSYLIEYDNGWEIISSDKRGPIVLAKCEGAPYIEEMMPDGAIIWLSSLNEDIAARWSSKVALQDDNPNEVASVNYWKSILKPIKQQSGIGNRFIDDPPLGDYVLVSSEITLEVYDSIPHLTTTKWHQEPPYNHACPLVHPDSTKRVPAGCGPVAGAQLLYYLHNKWGTPAAAPSYAYCEGYIPAPNYTFHTTGLNNTVVWSEMNNNTSPLLNKAYILVADVGDKASATYGENGTGAAVTDMMSAFNYYNIGCSLSPGRDSTIIRSHLLNGIPIFTTAYRYDHNTNEESGHSFLIDGYIRYRQKYTDTYMWTWLNNGPGSPILPQPGELVELVHYSSPIIHLIKMNWGWKDPYNYYSSLSFALHGTWEPKENYSYDHSFSLVHSFNILN